jgi:hypothetical protein
MSSSEANELTDLARIFLQPANPTHRQYEALRAFFVEQRPSTEVARRFGYTPNSFRVLCHRFRQNPHRLFFLAPAHGPSSAPKTDRVREEVIALRKQNLSIYDISAALERAGRPLSPPAVAQILHDEGFARLPRRRDDERPARVRPEAAAVADVRALDLSPRRFRTKFGGLFLFLPALASIPFDAVGLPGTQMIPAGCALRSLLALKLFGNARHLHVMPHVFDEGLALFAGLNVIPKRAFLTEYSARIDPAVYPTWMARWFAAVARLGLELGTSFDLDFHTIPFHGEDALVEKHYVSKRSRRQKGVLAFVAQDATTRLFCYANAQLRKDEQADEILRFVAFWKAGCRSRSSPCAAARPSCSKRFEPNPLRRGDASNSKAFGASTKTPASSTPRSRSPVTKGSSVSSPSPISATSNLRCCSPTSCAARPRSSLAATPSA